MFRRAVAADEASKPALDSTPSIATVSRADSPKALATGPTTEMDVWSFEKDRADLEQDAAMRFSRSCESEAFRPKDRRAAPEKSAALARSVPTAAANFRTLSCIAVICPSVKPRRAREVCREVTSAAVKDVRLPSSIADSVRLSISLTDLPRTEASSELAFSKSFIVLTALDRPLTSAPMDTRPAAIPPRDLVSEPAMDRSPPIFLGSCSAWTAAPLKAFFRPSASLISALRSFAFPWSL